MVAAVVVVGVAAIAVSCVPNIRYLPQGVGFRLVHPAHHVFVHLFAVAHSARFNLQGFVEKVVLAGDDVHKVADALGGMGCAVEVDVDATAGVGEGSRLAQPANKLLQGFDVLAVCEDGADQLDAVFAARRNPPPVLLALAGNAAVAHELPLATVRGCNRLGVVVIVTAVEAPAKVLGCDLRRLPSGDARELDFNPKFLCKHAFCSFQSVRLLFACTFITLKGLNSKSI